MGRCLSESYSTTLTFPSTQTLRSGRFEIVLLMEEGVSTKTPGSNWPGERDPSRKDVEEANDVPEPAWLSEFKGCLLADSEIQHNEPLMHLDLQVSSLDPPEVRSNSAYLTPGGWCKKVYVPFDAIIGISFTTSVGG